MPSGCTDDPVKYEEFMDTYSGGHGHINDASSWGYWSAGGYAVVRGDAPDIGCGEGNSVTPVFSISVISGPGSGAPGSQLTFVVEVQRDGTAASGQTVTFNVSPNDGTATLGPQARRLVETDGHRQR